MNRKQHAGVLRVFRLIHRQMGALLFVFFFVVSASGLLLAWKKNSNGLILAKSYQGTSDQLGDWLPMDSLHRIACRVLAEQVSPSLSPELDRIDARPDKGMVKFIFLHHFRGIQLDAATGKVLHIERRNGDLIEKIHDGSILDYLLQTPGGILKLIYSSVTGVALLLFTITGFWLWYGPKVMRRKRQSPS